MKRRVDVAMQLRRPDKEAVRQLWLEVVRSARDEGAEGTVYLTLAGAEGHDIGLMLDSGIARRTEVGSVLQEDADLLVAVEASSAAVLALQSKFPGLRILDMPIQDLLHGPSPIRWPTGGHLRYCRAKVVNLDLNSALHSSYHDGVCAFPLVNLINKFATLHELDPRLDWDLLLTMPAELACPHECTKEMQAFIAANLDRDDRFADDCERVMGREMCGRVRALELFAGAPLTPGERQALFMAFVPKRIASAVYARGWRVETSRNLRYGGRGSAHMVTWVLRFRWDARIATAAEQVYLDSLRAILARVGNIEEDGRILG